MTLAAASVLRWEPPGIAVASGTYSRSRSVLRRALCARRRSVRAASRRRRSCRVSVVRPPRVSSSWDAGHTTAGCSRAVVIAADPSRLDSARVSAVYKKLLPCDARSPPAPTSGLPLAGGASSAAGL